MAGLQKKFAEPAVEPFAKSGSAAVRPDASGVATALRRAPGFWYRLVRHRAALAGLVLVSVFVVVALVGAALSLGGGSTLDQGQPLLGPSLDHPFGTDGNGRDVALQIAHGAYVSLGVGLLAVTLAIGVGVPLGIVAGYMGGWVDLILGRLIDIMMAFPSLLLALVIVAIRGPGLENITLAVGLVGAPLFARQLRAAAIVVRNHDYVTAARALGATRLRILWATVLPNCRTPILVLGTLGIGTAMLDVAGLSFLGLSGSPATPEWGRMLHVNQVELMNQPLLVLAPGGAIFLTVLGFNLLGDGLRDLLDP